MGGAGGEVIGEDPWSSQGMLTSLPRMGVLVQPRNIFSQTGNTPVDGRLTENSAARKPHLRNPFSCSWCPVTTPVRRLVSIGRTDGLQRLSGAKSVSSSSSVKAVEPTFPCRMASASFRFFAGGGEAIVLTGDIAEFVLSHLLCQSRQQTLIL